jgi:hypothetical protein
LLAIYCFRVLTIERPKPDLRALLIGHGYVQAKNELSTFGETLWMHSSVIDELDTSGAGIEVSSN